MIRQTLLSWLQELMLLRAASKKPELQTVRDFGGDTDDIWFL